MLRDVLRMVFLAVAAVTLFVGLFVLLLGIVRNDLTTAGWTVAVVGTLVGFVLTVVLTFTGRA